MRLARSIFAAAAFALGAAFSPAAAAPAPAGLAPGLAGIGFLAGTWTSGTGRVAETGQTASGTSSFTVEAGGNALLRRDHTDLSGTGGSRPTSFEQIMLIYVENGALRADYTDGSHVIHYVSAAVSPGTSVVFSTAASPAAPSFRLTYALAGPSTLSVRFETAAPGQTAFHAIATGTLQKAE